MVASFFDSLAGFVDSTKILPGALALAALLGGVYLLQLGVGGTGALLPRMGMAYPNAIADGAFWTLASANLLNDNLPFALVSIAFVLIVGSRVEGAIGPARMATAFFLGALLGTTLSSLVTPNQFHLGGLGGGWGLIAAEVVLVASPSRQNDRHAVSTPAHVKGLVVLNLVIAIVTGFDVMTLLGGVLGGACVAMLARTPNTLWRFAAASLVATHVGALAIALAKGQPWNGWPTPEPPVFQTFYDGQIRAPVPAHLQVSDTDGVAQAGNLYWDGSWSLFYVRPKNEVFVFHDTLQNNWQIQQWKHVPCTPACVIREGSWYNGMIYTSSQMVGNNVLITVNIVQSGAPRPPLNGIRYVERQAAFVQAIAIRPDEPGLSAKMLTDLVAAYPDWPEVLNSLAWQYATHPDADQRNGREAELLARRALEIEPRTVGYMDTLAAALAEQGDFEAAVLVEVNALALAPDSPMLQANLEQLRAGQPIRDLTDE